MVSGQIVAAVLIVVAMWLIATMILPPLLAALLNLILIFFAAWQAMERWKTKSHYWYEMGIIFSFLITMFYHSAFPVWPVTTFVVLAVLIAEFLQWVERTTL
ncbi:MAG: hypothetical protein ACE5FT_00305 [Candidatus Nanoarchaeia archaeon]